MRPTMPDPSAKRAFATEVVRRLREAGYTALWAGGCVRDLLLGGEPDDYDVATDATPEQVMGLFRRTVPVGVSFGVVRVLGPRGAGEVEVATFRSDGAYVDGRGPVGVVFSTPELDAPRRDFTINGMFSTRSTARSSTIVGGRADLEAGVLRAIGDPAARFAEDKLRLLRAVRFAARFGLQIEPADPGSALVGDGRRGSGRGRRADRPGAAEDAGPPAAGPGRCGWPWTSAWWRPSFPTSCR